MKRSYWHAVRLIDWDVPVLTGILGVVLLFVWGIIRSGESGPELPRTHLLGEIMVFAGWSSIVLFVFLVWRAVEAARHV